MGWAGMGGMGTAFGQGGAGTAFGQRAQARRLFNAELPEPPNKTVADVCGPSGLDRRCA